MTVDGLAGASTSRLRAATVALVALVASAAIAAPGGPVIDASQDAVSLVDGDVMAAVGATEQPITFVQANINKDMRVAKFDKDLVKVFAERPDIITFNEVHNRDSAKLAPEGYEIFRTPGPRTGWAPVVWRTDAWTAIDQGTWKISGKPKKLRNTPGMTGVRYANWVTLTNAEGQVLSVISAHIAPNSRDTAGLLVPSLKRLATLATELGAAGPVVLGGDFNMGLRSSRYKPRYLTEAGLTSTYDVLGTSFPTHRGGGTIDYVFLGPTSEFEVDEHYPVLLKSDHRMIVAHLRLRSSAAEPPADPGSDPDTDSETQEKPAVSFSPGKVTTTPRGSAAERTVVRRMQLKAIRATPAGAAIHVASDRIRGRVLLDALMKAKERGAHVTVITAEKRLNARQQALRAMLGTKKSASDYFVIRKRAWRSSGRGVAKLDPTVLLISQAGATPAYGMVATSNMGRAPLTKRYRKRTKATISTDGGTYDTLYRAYLAVIGRGY
ncbi:hypothetical protein E8D34_09755 [Nocardioides sp. GY 10113]|uniref:endonuclease/exonuclease/phosphatase family protein n=1 Tax=Nocardioides sp. GY 10113 TaxID=2569761 RepID=UPI0010A79325|nr:endonuclease/exonuclease/phosphatase family protein [Nocardioides sp. GY 10113]TIC87407.1 hypothetical protein E8D34_09755 [Nocardioides sp. GY 10113]